MLRASFVALIVFFTACGDDSMSPVDGGNDVLIDVPLDRADDTNDIDLADVPDAMDVADVPDVPDVPDTFDAGPPCDGPPGLYIDAACQTLAPGVRSYNPQYWLWSDGTDKHRFISLPAGSQIDTSDPDNWIYPRGTRVWKTFLVGEMRVETRLFEKFSNGTGLANWSVRTFLWNEAGDAVTEVNMAGLNDVLGTDHDIPSRMQCLTCHVQNGRQDVLNGFTAIQLNHEDTEFSLADLNDEGWLTNPVDVADAVVPGDETTSEALGYLHANCGSCHGGPTPQAGFTMWVDVGTATPEETGTYVSGVDVASLRTFDTAVLRIAAGDPDNSVILTRMESREVGVQMPQIGTEAIDPTGIMTVRDWVVTLPSD